MEEASAEKLRRLFLVRDIALAPPATDSAIEAVERKAGCSLSHAFKSVYGQFDGFANGEFDPVTELRLWPLSEVMDALDGTGTTIIRFADFSCHAEVFAFDAARPDAAVLNDEAGTTVAASIGAFWEKWLGGGFDF